MLRAVSATTATDRRAAGALDPAWFARWLEERGPWAFHVTQRGNREAILRDGLVPWDQHGVSGVFTTTATPRPGCVYLVTDRDGCEHQWELSAVDPRSGLVVCVDLRQIDPSRIVPDEDPWFLGVLDPDDRRWGLDPRASEQIGEGKRWRTGGQWAEAIELGMQPGVVEWGLTSWGRLAIVGRIAPRALTVVACDSDGRWILPGD
jgi:hypothetical protein